MIAIAERTTAAGPVQVSFRNEQTEIHFSATLRDGVVYTQVREIRLPDPVDQISLDETPAPPSPADASDPTNEAGPPTAPPAGVVDKSSGTHHVHFDQKPV